MNDSGTALATAFQAIEDPRERLENLAKLIESLSPWEHRLARLQLGSTSGLAGLEDLPADIACHLLRHLHIEDAIACAAVSRRCRATWSEPSVAASLSRRFFPALQPPFTSSTFTEACRRYFRRRAGRFTRRFEMSLPPRTGAQEWERDCRRMLRPDPLVHPDGKYPRPWLDFLHASFACFGGGNLVWFAFPNFFVVDNMYARTRRVVRMDNATSADHSEFEWSAASKSLVVLQPHSLAKLYAFNCPRVKRALGGRTRTRVMLT
ncbi:F-box protein, partial [Candidatus Bathyarchaeota archaeon]|nr:F-box protein [Candidatus Bathyarchaeota archaeon]